MDERNRRLPGSVVDRTGKPNKLKTRRITSLVQAPTISRTRSYPQKETARRTRSGFLTLKSEDMKDVKQYSQLIPENGKSGGHYERAKSFALDCASPHIAGRRWSPVSEKPFQIKSGNKRSLGKISSSSPRRKSCSKNSAKTVVTLPSSRGSSSKTLGLLKHKSDNSPKYSTLSLRGHEIDLLNSKSSRETLELKHKCEDLQKTVHIIEKWAEWILTHSF